MRTAVYTAACLAGIGITAGRCYAVVRLIREEPAGLGLILPVLAAIGWGMITYGIVTKRYKWIQKFCK